MKPPSRFTFAAADRTALVGTLYEPDADNRSAVLIAGGLGVAQRHYASIASWPAGRGHVVLSFDLRGMGAYRQAPHERSQRGLDADLLTWAGPDFPATVAHLVQVNEGRPITGIGHSLGLHHAGLTDKPNPGPHRPCRRGRFGSGLLAGLGSALPAAGAADAACGRPVAGAAVRRLSGPPPAHARRPAGRCDAPVEPLVPAPGIRLESGAGSERLWKRHAEAVEIPPRAQGAMAWDMR